MDGCEVVDGAAMRRHVWVDLPNHVRAWRKEKKLTLRALAEDIGTSFQNLSNIECGRTRLTADMLEAIATRLGTTSSAMRDGPPGEGTGLESDLLALFRGADAVQRKLIVEMARTIRSTTRAEAWAARHEADSAGAEEKERPPG